MLNSRPPKTTLPHRKARLQPEFASQCALFQWAHLPSVIRMLPGIELLEGSLNGVKLTKAQAGKAKAAGMLRGAHDVRLPVARGRWIGLSIELKAGDNSATADQLRIAGLLEAEGWRVCFIWDWIEAKTVITEYLFLPRPAIVAA